MNQLFGVLLTMIGVDLHLDHKKFHNDKH
jgi:hypothetical protein